jgi:NAD(P)-dependent dehydrogenase (short-subunit alcohol dehydrogenase family)
MSLTLVTGATRGIGRGLVEAAWQAGEPAIGTHRGGSPPGFGSRDGWLHWDGDAPDCGGRLAAALGERPLSLLVCNAGLYLGKGDTLERGFDADVWARIMRVNVGAVFLTVQALLPALERGANPRIALIASQMGSSARAPGGAYAYRASKAAVVNLGRNLARDLAPRGIAVGIYHPGWVRTDMGGAGAEIDLSESVSGLRSRFAALGPATSGCFEDWRGIAIPF